MTESGQRPVISQDGVFSVQLSDHENAGIEIYNALGETVLKQVLQNELTRLDLAEFNNGIYHVRVTKDNSLLYSGRIVKGE